MTKLRRALQGGYLRRALVVALVVGTALNAINQPEAIFGASSIVWWKAVLTYLVPFFVATYATYSTLPNN